MKKVTIFTDGACSGNPGRGGWAALLKYIDKTKTICGGEADTTNNRMELLAVINALELLKEPCCVELFTDSKYVKEGITKWIQTWQNKHWRKSDGQLVKNVELWQRLLALSQKHKINWSWVKGHAGIPENEIVDQLARGQAKGKC